MTDYIGVDCSGSYNFCFAGATDSAGAQGTISLGYQNQTDDVYTPLWRFLVSNGEFRPETDKKAILGDPTYAWKNVTSYGFTTKSSRTYVTDYKSAYGKTALDMLDEIKVESNGIWDIDSIPASYKTGDFWQVNEKKMVAGRETLEPKTYQTFEEIPDELKPQAEHHALIDLNARDDTCETAIRELNAKFKAMQQELCAKDPRYEFCLL